MFVLVAVVVGLAIVGAGCVTAGTFWLAGPGAALLTIGAFFILAAIILSIGARNG